MRAHGLLIVFTALLLLALGAEGALAYTVTSNVTVNVSVDASMVANVTLMPVNMSLVYPVGYLVDKQCSYAKLMVEGDIGFLAIYEPTLNLSKPFMEQLTEQVLRTTESYINMPQAYIEAIKSRITNNIRVGDEINAFLVLRADRLDIEYFNYAFVLNPNSTNPVWINGTVNPIIKINSIVPLTCVVTQPPIIGRPSNVTLGLVPVEIRVKCTGYVPGGNYIGLPFLVPAQDFYFKLGSVVAVDPWSDAMEVATGVDENGIGHNVLVLLNDFVFVRVYGLMMGWLDFSGIRTQTFLVLAGATIPNSLHGIVVPAGAVGGGGGYVNPRSVYFEPLRYTSWVRSIEFVNGSLLLEGPAAYLSPVKLSVPGPRDCSMVHYYDFVNYYYNYTAPPPPPITIGVNATAPSISPEFRQYRPSSSTAMGILALSVFVAIFLMSSAYVGYLNALFITMSLVLVYGVLFNDQYLMTVGFLGVVGAPLLRYIRGSGR